MTGRQDIEEINELVRLFCKRVDNNTPAYLSLEFRNGTLKFTMNNFPSAPYSRQPTGGRPARYYTAAPNWPIPPPCATPGATSTAPTEAPPVPPDVQPAAGVPTAPTAPTTRASAMAKKRKANVTPPTSTPEVARTNRHQENLQVSHLGTPDRLADDESCGNSDVMVDEIEEEEESTQIECDFFSKNKFSILDVQTTPRPAAANAVAVEIDDSVRADDPATLAKLSLGVCNHCKASCNWVARNMSTCVCCKISCFEGPFDPNEK